MQEYWNKFKEWAKDWYDIVVYKSAQYWSSLDGVGKLCVSVLAGGLLLLILMAIF